MFSYYSFLKWNFDLNRIYFFICHWNALRNSVCIFSTSFGLMQEKRIINFITKSPKIVCFSYLLTSYLCRALCQSFKNKLTHKISFSWQSDLCDVSKKNRLIYYRQDNFAKFTYMFVGLFFKKFGLIFLKRCLEN